MPALCHACLRSRFFNTIIHRIPFHGFEAGAVDHFDDLLLGHFDFAARFDGVAVGEFAVGDGAVEVVGAEVEGGLGGAFSLPQIERLMHGI